MNVETQHGRMSAARAFLTEYEWLHTMIGIAGNVLFVIGSLMFMSPTLQRYAIGCFITGSTGMLIGNVAAAIVRVRRHRVR